MNHRDILNQAGARGLLRLGELRGRQRKSLPRPGLQGPVHAAKPGLPGPPRSAWPPLASHLLSATAPPPLAVMGAQGGPGVGTGFPQCPPLSDEVAEAQAGKLTCRSHTASRQLCSASEVPVLWEGLPETVTQASRFPNRERSSLPLQGEWVPPQPFPQTGPEESHHG